MTTLFLSGYPSDRPGIASGLGRVDYDDEHGFTRAVELPGPTGASWALRAASEDLFVVAEGPGAVTRVHPDRGITEQSHTGGRAPCHLALSPDGQWLVASNYESGSIALLSTDGGLQARDTLSFAGSGPHERQASPHAHQAVFLDDETLLVCDLGSDRVHRVRVQDAQLLTAGSIELPAGTGPRHLARHPGRDDVLWVVGELDQQVHVLSNDEEAEGGWSVAHSVSTAPDGPAQGETTTAGIAVDPAGRWVYVSTRGTDTVSVFTAGDDGRLELHQQVPTDHWPRFIGWLPGQEGRRLVVAAERAGTVRVLQVKEDGTLQPGGHELSWAGITWAG